MTDIDVVSNCAAVEEKIAKAAAVAGRDAKDIALTIVSKTWPAERIRPLLAAGYRQFGENRVQEARGKWPDLKAEFPGTRLHLIGSLQSNKAEDAAALFDVIETLDREKLAKVFAKLFEAGGPRPDLYVQVNTGEEAQKGGIAPKEAVAFTRWARDDLGLPVLGLMAIPPAEEPPAPHFARLHKLAAEAKVPRISMGMSGDYEIAAQLGATEVRVGSAIFGPRAPH